jgi:hypothetical protein
MSIYASLPPVGTIDENVQTGHRHSLGPSFRPTTIPLPSTSRLPSILLRPLASCVFVLSARFCLCLYPPFVSCPPFLPNLNLPPQRAGDLLSGRPGLVKKGAATRSNGAQDRLEPGRPTTSIWIRPPNPNEKMAAPATSGQIVGIHRTDCDCAGALVSDIELG